MAGDADETPNEADAKSARIVELEAELAALKDQQEEQVEEAIDEAAETVDGAVQEAAEEAAEAIEGSTGETLSPDDVRILKGIIAGQVAAEAAPETVVTAAEANETVDEMVEAEQPPDTAPVRTHILDRKIW